MYAQETVCLIFIQFYNENKHFISSHRQTTLAVPMIILCDKDQLWSWAKRGGEGGEVDKSLWLLDKKKSDLPFLGHDKELSEPSSAVMLINKVVHA